MDLHLNQWRSQDDESYQHQLQPPGKIPKLMLEEGHHHTSNNNNNLSALPLFVSESPTATSSRLLPPRMGSSSYFSVVQWQELELQALIYRYMLAGAAVPSELLQPIKKSLLHLHSSPYFLPHPLQHYSFYHPALLQTGYWGRAVMDPEPGRCRRTDGKKWRCSRDVVTGQKYCERHVHRGRNRSRKPVETPTPISAPPTTTSTTHISLVAAGAASNYGVSAFNAAGGFSAAPPLTMMGDGNSNNNFSLGGQSPSADLLQLSHSSFASKAGPSSDAHILRPFFDDWPRSVQRPNNPTGTTDARPGSSVTCLSISMPGNPSSDVSLKLATGDDLGPRDNGREHSQASWASGWASAAQVSSMGGPLAEALRSSNSSPTSVLHQLSRGSVSEAASYVTT